MDNTLGRVTVVWITHLDVSLLVERRQQVICQYMPWTEDKSSVSTCRGQKTSHLSVHAVDRRQVICQYSPWTEDKSSVSTCRGQKTSHLSILAVDRRQVICQYMPWTEDKSSVNTRRGQKTSHLSVHAVDRRQVICQYMPWRESWLGRRSECASDSVKSWKTGQRGQRLSALCSQPAAPH